MKIIIFAGGVGTRLWPLSRKNTPKQFEKIIGERSSIQEAVLRLYPTFVAKDIYIATGLRYKDIIEKQLPDIPKENFIYEPEMRDVGPAIGMAAVILEKLYPDEPIAMLWSDHLVKDAATFQKALLIAKEKVEQKTSDFIFIGQRPRFASQNLGYIHCGDLIEEQDNIKLYKFLKLKYRPDPSQAEEFFNDDSYIWNFGYFVTTTSYLVSLYQKFVPKMYSELKEIQDSYGKNDFLETVSRIYPTLEKISFDNAILEKLDTDNICALSVDVGWSDIGAWEALKEALSQTKDENVTRGNVMLEGSRDTLLFNYTNQLLVGIDMDEMLIVATEDVVLVCPKSSVPKIKKLVESLSGTD